MSRYAVEVKGIVQGVGFRPFVFRAAKALSLCGFVRNTSQGVSIEIEGNKIDCETFISELKDNPPPLSLVENISVSEISVTGDKDFIILTSREGSPNTFISPDIGICDECAADISDINNRRYRYAFTNCTNCGPRFTIVQDIPYDRKNTTMADFAMCAECNTEYENPYNRRFHAQPNACPVCGPHLSFYQQGKFITGDPIELFKKAIDCGQIVALKGIGGFHIACDANNEKTVSRLRKQKLRYDKPFAVMMRNIETVLKYCELDDQEKHLLTSPAKPIVLLKKKEKCFVSPSTTLLNNRLGVMLPYTPLHSILMQEQEALIMTSGNLSDRPMIFNDNEALSELAAITDAVLTHNRRIYRRMDDSVCMIVHKKVLFLRRARGVVPEPLPLKENKYNILALGAQQKNTFCLAKGENAFISGHIGDLDDDTTAKCLENEIEAFKRIFDVTPEAVVCDYHPDYVSTRYAFNYSGKLPVIQIQHHHAHFASVLAEHKIADNTVLGFIFDGTGYGEDGCVWGGECLAGNIAGSIRSGHLLYFPLLGGEQAIREPWRAALALADMAVDRESAVSLFPEYKEISPVLLNAGDRKINSPLTSSMGRLFDAVAALTGVRTYTTYEGQAAVDLQQIMDLSAHGSYQFKLADDNGTLIFDWRPVIRDIITDIKNGVSAGTVSFRFHQAVADLITAAAIDNRNKTNCNSIALSGGVFQNDFLLENAVIELEQNGFSVFTNEKIPVNDGGISFGQAAAASYKLRGV